jgi:hypothetical protein
LQYQYQYQTVLPTDNTQQLNFKQPNNKQVLEIHTVVLWAVMPYFLVHVNGAAEWLTLLLHVLGVPASNLSPETSYPDYGLL